MKNLFKTILCFALLIFFVGCSGNADLNVGINIKNNLNKLLSVVNNLDTIDNNYIINPDITYTSNQQSQTNTNIISSELTTKINVDHNNSYDAINSKNLNNELIQEYSNEFSKYEFIENLPYFSNNQNYENIDVQNLNNNESLLYYYAENNFTPEILKYNPRYVSNYNSDNTSKNINNYVYKIQKLYAISEDVIEANNVLNLSCKNLQNNINEILKLNEILINKNTQPSKQKVVAINNYLKDLETTRKRIKACNGELNDEILNINSNNNIGVTNSIDIINSNYIKILNHIDTRINYFENALATLEQLNYIIDDILLTESITNYDVEFKSNINTYTNEINEDDSNFNNLQSLNENNKKDICNVDTFSTKNNNNEKILSNNTINNNNNIQEGNSLENNYSIPLENGINTTNNNISNNSSNGIINENNLNNTNNNYNNAYYYDADGNLYNSNNNKYALNNYKNNTNVDTYNYNTLVDVINRGTIDNGINNLDIKLLDNKPVMVNNSSQGA